MDYHSLKRVELQALCKQHKIPANKTNVFMADGLTSLLGDAVKAPELEPVVMAADTLDAEAVVAHEPVVKKSSRAPRAQKVARPDDAASFSYSRLSSNREHMPVVVGSVVGHESEMPKGKVTKKMGSGKQGATGKDKQTKPKLQSEKQRGSAPLQASPHIDVSCEVDVEEEPRDEKSSRGDEHVPEVVGSVVDHESEMPKGKVTKKMGSGKQGATGKDKQTKPKLQSEKQRGSAPLQASPQIDVYCEVDVEEEARDEKSSRGDEHMPVVVGSVVGHESEMPKGKVTKKVGSGKKEATGKDKQMKPKLQSEKQRGSAPLQASPQIDVYCEVDVEEARDEKSSRGDEHMPVVVGSVVGHESEMPKGKVIKKVGSGKKEATGKDKQSKPKLQSEKQRGSAPLQASPQIHVYCELDVEEEARDVKSSSTKGSDDEFVTVPLSPLKVEVTDNHPGSSPVALNGAAGRSRRGPRQKKISEIVEVMCDKENPVMQSEVLPKSMRKLKKAYKDKLSKKTGKAKADNCNSIVPESRGSALKDISLNMLPQFR